MREGSNVKVGEYLGLGALVVLLYLLSVMTYSQLGEDSFISFRYVQNIADGKGFVYNEGERVEGYSNLFWVLVHVPFAWLGTPLHLVSRLLSTGFFAVLALGGWWAARRMLGEEQPWWVVWWLPVALALEPLLHYHDDRGLETVPYAALLGLMLLWIGANGSLWIAGLFGALAAWTRPEGIIFAVALLPAVMMRAAEYGHTRRIDIPRVVHDSVKFLLLPLGFFLAQLLFRKVYYGEWVPNTMIAKRAGGGGGWFQIISLTATHALLPLIGAAGLVLGLRSSRLRVLSAGGLLTMAAGCAFQLRAGGLFNEGFRYLIPVVVPSVIGAWMLVVLLAEAMEPRRFLSGRIVTGGAAVLLLAVVPVLFFEEYSGDRWLLRGNGNAPRTRLLSRLTDKTSYNLPERFRYFLQGPNFINAEAGKWARENLPPDAVIGADQMGQFGYYAGKNQTIIDLLGLMDSHIARHGLTVEYIRARRPQYMIVETCLDSTFWPREWRLRPHLAILREFFARPAMQEDYRPRWLLRWRVSIMQIGFMVHVHRDQDDGLPLEEVWMGVRDEEFERAWRVL